MKNGLTNDEWNVIIMDEAHRSASGESVQLIKKHLRKQHGLALLERPIFIVMKLTM